MSYDIKMPLKQVPVFVNRTYKGGKLMAQFLNLGLSENTTDSFYPEVWISSFIEAKNRIYIKNEGVSKVITECGEQLITDIVTANDFGEDRTESGVLVKLLDAGERLGIQVHPNKNFAKRVFNSAFGKTECWHILDTRVEGNASIYLGFKEYVTKDLWRKLYEKQDISAMLDAMHKFEVSAGDTILVVGGTPHAIGEGCFLLEIQEPSDYTMRVEKITPNGDVLTPMQLHYGVGEENLFDCFDYTPKSREQVYSEFFLSSKLRKSEQNPTCLVTYNDTPCFSLDRLDGGNFTISSDSFYSLVVTENGGTMTVLRNKNDTVSMDKNIVNSIKNDSINAVCTDITVKLYENSVASVYENEKIYLSRGDIFFIPSHNEICFENTFALLCYPPSLVNNVNRQVTQPPQ